MKKSTDSSAAAAAAAAAAKVAKIAVSTAKKVSDIAASNFLALTKDLSEVKNHVEILNTETGELRDIVREIKADLTAKAGRNADNIAKIDISLSQVQTDIAWMKQWFWLLASTSLGAVTMGVINFLTKR